jgi:hypothetical protein
MASHETGGGAPSVTPDVVVGGADFDSLAAYAAQAEASGVTNYMDPNAPTGPHPNFLDPNGGQ